MRTAYSSTSNAPGHEQLSRVKTKHIDELVHKLGYSHKHTLRLFKEHIGMTPKLFARLVRFEHVRRAIRSSSSASIAELARRFGYSDQAHLVREVRHFAGASPTELRRTPTFEAKQPR